MQDERRICTLADLFFGLNSIDDFDDEARVSHLCNALVNGVFEFLSQWVPVETEVPSHLDHGQNCSFSNTCIDAVFERRRRLTILRSEQKTLWTFFDI